MSKEKKQETSDMKPKFFKKHRGGIELTKDEIKHIRTERKKLRKQMKAQGLKKKRDFEVTASSLGLYFDKKRRFGFLWWLFHGRAFWALLGALLLLLTVIYLASIMTQLKGHFTINMSEDMFKNGFILSETEDFANPDIQLFSQEVEEVPCISFSSIPADVDDFEGNHGDGTYFAYTYFLRNEGEETVDYHYSLEINSESQNLSDAVWIMLFEDGKMKFFAKPSTNGSEEVIPAYSINDRGYPNPVLLSKAAESSQFQFMGSRGGRNFYRIIPINFDSDTIVEENMRYDIEPMQVHKYTVVIWLEGDDPECTDDKIGAHLGLEMNYQLIDEYEEEQEEDIWKQIGNTFEDLTDALRFWEN